MRLPSQELSNNSKIAPELAKKHLIFVFIQSMAWSVRCVRQTRPINQRSRLPQQIPFRVRRKVSPVVHKVLLQFLLRDLISPRTLDAFRTSTPRRRPTIRVATLSCQSACSRRTRASGLSVPASCRKLTSAITRTPGEQGSCSRWRWPTRRGKFVWLSLATLSTGTLDVMGILLPL
jgi:hypothetical protein